MADFVTPGGLSIEPSAVTWSSTRSGGPGGQHANTSDTAVTLTVDLSVARLPANVRRRVIDQLGDVVSARSADTRSQWRNRQLAWDRLAVRIDEAARPPRRRHPTRPSRSSVSARLDRKRRRGGIKRFRQNPTADD